MKELIIKYEKELKELRKYLVLLKKEYCKNQREATKFDYNKTLTKVKMLEKIIEDLKELNKNSGELDEKL